MTPLMLSLDRRLSPRLLWALVQPVASFDFHSRHTDSDFVNVLFRPSLSHSLLPSQKFPSSKLSHPRNWSTDLLRLPFFWFDCDARPPYVLAVPLPSAVASPHRDGR